MTNLDEYANINKYKRLDFIEFLDMLCRIAIVGVTTVDTLDYNTHFLLELIYTNMHQTGDLEKDKYKLYPVDENLRGSND